MNQIARSQYQQLQTMYFFSSSSKKSLFFSGDFSVFLYWSHLNRRVRLGFHWQYRHEHSCTSMMHKLYNVDHPNLQPHATALIVIMNLTMAPGTASTLPPLWGHFYLLAF
jgi:hypothetical protein